MAFEPDYINTNDGYKVNKRCTFRDPYNNDWYICHNASNNSVIIMKEDNTIHTILQYADSITLKDVIPAIGYDLNTCGLANVYISDNTEISHLISTTIPFLPCSYFEVDIEIIPNNWY
jgi:hypothetical protein